MGRLRDHERSALAAVENYAVSQGDTADGVLGALERLHAQALSPSEAEGYRDRSAVAVLFYFVRQLRAACEHDGAHRRRNWKAGDAVHERAVRFVRDLKGLDHSPWRRRSEPQQYVKPTNALSALSLVLARIAQAYRVDACAAYAASNRAGRLRGYGNAIVPHVAQAFIEAYLECRI